MSICALLEGWAIPIWFTYSTVERQGWAGLVTVSESRCSLPRGSYRQLYGVAWVKVFVAGGCNKLESLPRYQLIECGMVYQGKGILLG